MATPKARATVDNETWADIAGAAASTAGVTWQNQGPSDAWIAFTTAAPTGADAIHILAPGEAFYDKNGSAHVWAQAIGPPATFCATAD